LGGLRKVAAQLKSPQKHREKWRKLLSAERWHFLKKFLPAQLCGA